MSSILTSAPPSPSLQSSGGSRASTPLDLAELETPTVQTHGLEFTEQKHSRYYFKDGNLIFLIEEKLYNVHRYFFERDSSYFRSILEGSQGTDANNPLVLPDVSCSDFDEFLAILYPENFRRPTEKTTPQWTSILHLAAKWEFESIKLLAIDNLTANAVPVDKIVLGRRYGIIEWLPEAYQAVCTREDSLTLQEGMKLGVQDVIKISAARQAYGCGKSRFETKYLSEDLGDIFGLDPSKTGPRPIATGGKAGEKQKKRNAKSSGNVDDEDDAIKALEGEVSDAQTAFQALAAGDGYCGMYPGEYMEYGPGSHCIYCGTECKSEIEEYRLKREDKEKKERQLKNLIDKRQQMQKELAAKDGRMALFQY
ncbi:hypothetical protein HWV62_23889 [Athelia sp. TMB]|nr:hypothetical protein HWV62_23889 [Athelia sp. TMB]